MLQNNTVQDLAQRWKTEVFLLDACGVLYSDREKIPGVAEVVADMQQKGMVYIITNNACDSHDAISYQLEQLNMFIKPSHIVSSGDALKMPDIAPLIHQKKVYVWGKKGSYEYVQRAGGISEPNLDSCEAIVIASSDLATSEDKMKKISNTLLKNPSIPVICCNPDRYVVGEDGGLFPVAGYFSRRLEVECGKDIIWVGKPSLRWTQWVWDTVIDPLGIMPNRVMFCDDNPTNVMSMKKGVGVRGVWVKNTGIGNIAFSDLEKSIYEEIVDATVDSIA